MSAGVSGYTIGYTIGAFLMLLFIAMVLVALLRLIPPLKRRPVIPYGAVALLIVLFAVRLARTDTADALLPMLLLACVLTLATLGWDYRRTVRKARAQVPSAPAP